MFSFVPARCVIQKSKKITKKIQKYHYECISRQNRLEKDEKERNKNYRSVPTRCVIENSKQIAKEIKKLKNTIVASFQAKIGRKRMRKRENKNYRSVPFIPDA